MTPDDLSKVIAELKREMAAGSPETTVAILGRTAAALDLVAFLHSVGFEDRLEAIYDDTPGARPLSELAGSRADIVVVAEDADKERYLDAVGRFLAPHVRVILGGYGHFAFRDDIYEECLRHAYVPSLANGYPNSLIHIFQCLRNAAHAGAKGIVVEFGMFKGGTTMLLSRFVEALGTDWKVMGFDTFEGFPAKRSPLDLYAHPDCIFLDESAARRYLRERDVEIVAGDVVDTVDSLRDQEIVLAFVDTDNYTSASRIIEAVADRIVPGGAFVFDHWTGRDRHLYTIGERMAARRLVDDTRFFNLHDTGVFMRVR